MNRYGIGIILALAIAVGGYYLVSTEANVGGNGVTTQAVKEKASEMAEKAKDKAKELTEKAKVAAAKTTEVAKEAAANTAVVATDAANKISAKAAETVDKAKAKVEEMRDAAAKETVVADASEKKEEAASDEPAAFGSNEKEYDEGKWVDPDGMPTYNIDGDGQVIKKVDWYTYSGWRRYHAECHVCHGPNGEGSTFAPALADSLKKMPYEKFLQVVSSGQRNKWGRENSVMPALGDNKNVMCYIDDIYIYLRARAEGAMPAGKLGAKQRSKKPDEAREFENECFDG